MTVPPSDRLDVYLAGHGLTRSRTHAARLIAAGRVRVDGEIVTRPSRLVDGRAQIDIAQDPYVGRAAAKLLAALAAFPIRVEGRHALDAGASTGGFTQVLLERGAEVVAVDVGHGQLSPLLAGHPRLRSYEGVNVRDLDAAAYARLTGGAPPPSLVVADLSFISLTRVVTALVATASDDADFVLLVKPQFEVGRALASGGVVRRREARRTAILGVVGALAREGVGVAGLIPSPVIGKKGNQEYLLHATRTTTPDPTEWELRTRQRMGGR